MQFDLSHLVHPDDEAILGPIQDSEALLLYAVCRVCCFRRVIEFGGLYGYSATNFLKAMEPDGVVYTVEMNEMKLVNDRHFHVHKQAGDVLSSDFGDKPVDLVFFDVHHLGQQMAALFNLEAHGVIHDGTVLAFHDTGLHPTQETGWGVPLGNHWIPQQIERKMVNILKNLGYEGLAFDCSDPLPPVKFRHGITLMMKKSLFAMPPDHMTQTICMPGHLIDGPLSRNLDSQGRTAEQIAALD